MSKQLKVTETKPRSFVSTVDLSAHYERYPFETMVFSERQGEEKACFRHETKEEAVMCHDVQVAKENFLQGASW